MLRPIAGGSASSAPGSPERGFHFSPQTNGMVERFNGRISELLQQTRFDSRAGLETTLLNYLKLYNHHIP